MYPAVNAPKLAAKRAKNLTKFCGIDSNFTNTLANKIKNNIQTKIPEINPKLKALSKNKEFLLDFTFVFRKLKTS